MTEPAERIIERLAAQRQELQAEITRLETAAQDRDGLASEVEKLRGHLGQVHEDIVAATRREGRLFAALEKSWAPPSTEPLTETEMRLATLNHSPTGMMYDVPEPEPEWGSPAHIDQLPTYQRAPRQEAPQPPPSAVPRSSTPTLKLTED